MTGASRGVGKGIALELARRGCRVAVNYQSSPERAEETVREVTALGVDAFAVRADVGVPADVIAMMDAAVARFGRLNILVNNAGVQTWTALLDVTEAEWDHVIATNLKGCFLCTQAAARHMKDHGGGAIVNIGSGCNKIAFPRLVAYTASKGGIEMLTKVAAVELGPLRDPGQLRRAWRGRDRADEARTGRLRRFLGQQGAPRSRRHAVRHRRGRRFRGQRRRVVHDRPDHLGGRRAVLAAGVDGIGDGPVFPVGAIGDRPQKAQGH